MISLMTTKTFKVLFFVALIAAIAVPVSGMDFATGQEQVIKPNLRISEPVDSSEKVANHDRAMANVDQRNDLYAEGTPLKLKYENEGMDALTEGEIADLDRITEEMKGLRQEMKQINTEARALIKLTQEEKNELSAQVGVLADSNIPFSVTFSDQNGEAVAVGFETQELGDKYAPMLQELLDVPFYTIVEKPAKFVTCSSQTSDCDPILGGVEITTKFNSNTWMGGSYSTATDRDVWWWTEYGFLTAAHLFEDGATSGHDVNQPNYNSGQIGDLKEIEWPTTNADCDCAFIEKTGSEGH